MSSAAMMSEPNTTVIYAGKITHRPLQTVSTRPATKEEGFGTILHDAVEEENRKPIIVLDAREAREVLVEIWLSLVGFEYELSVRMGTHSIEPSCSTS